jgi:hypothetical protein
MNDQEINIAIADCIPGATGKWWCPTAELWVDSREVTYNETQASTGYPVEPYPSYTTDLNAMYEAFRTSLHRHWSIEQAGDGYICEIQFGPKNKDLIVAGLELLPVMAEAFLRVHRKWKDES